MVLAGNERRALEQLLEGEIGQFRSEIGLDKAAKKDDMVSSKWLPLFLYCTTDKIFRSGFQKRLATITVRELIKLPKANPHTIRNNNNTTTTTHLPTRQQPISHLSGSDTITAAIIIRRS
ncbi:hypothetical protein FOZ63_033294 [Perkinsus olseni]|uniref:Uncharacterized protein n=1 Tax=Perkinsus olseni TaxID=32597 RepID=A0A7J6Q3Z6_PEROL|nr:hypothetical protein FOZ63_033294 [Perkinsus olseni]